MKLSKNKSGKIEAFLKGYNVKFSILSFSEQSMCNDEIDHLNIENFVVSTTFCRSMNKNGGAIVVGSGWNSFIRETGWQLCQLRR